MHPPVRKALVEALRLVVEENQYSDKVLEQIGKTNRQFGSRDRRALATHLYAIVRSWRKLSAQNANYEAVVDLFTETQGNVDTANMEPAIRLSVCDELYNRMIQELGEEKTEALLSSMDQQADVFIRTNTLKSDQASLLSELTKDGYGLEVQSEPYECLRLRERKNLFISEAYKAGKFEVQDSGSQSLVGMLSLKPGEKVIDACAGAGGKALQMAALMKNKGRIIAMDIHQWKLNELRKRARRGGVDIIETRVIESSKTIKRLHSSADKILLDVPCTGTGVIKRKPDTKLKYTSSEHEGLIETQAYILDSYSKMLKVGGKMLYATCSVFPSENETQIKNFLARSESDWKLDSEKYILPTVHNSDGFFATLLTKQS